MLYLISLLMSLCILPRSETQGIRTKVMNGNHTFTYYLKDFRSFSSAELKCSNSGSRLVEIYDSDIDTFLRKHMLNGEWFYTGGKNPSGNEVTWSSGRQSSFTNWIPRNNDRKEPGCIVIQDDGWYDEFCTRTNRYICESARVNNLRLSSQQVTVTEGSIKQVTCNANGIPTPSVQWSFNSVGSVTADMTASTYQVASSGISTLNFKRVMAKDEGNYSCTARNSAGLVPTSQMDNFELKAPSSPILLAATPVACTSMLTVKWKPSQYSINTLHKLTIKVGNDKNERFEVITIPTTAQLQTYQKSLSPWTSYTVAIKPCPNQICLEHYTTSNSTPTTTEGIPGTVENMSVQLHGTRSCLITWKKPRDVPGGKISDYKIIVNESIESSNASIYNEEISITVPGNTTRYIFEGQPSGSYWIAVQAHTCAGGGDIIRSSKGCVTPKNPKSNSSGSSWIVGATIGPLSLLLMISAVTIYIKCTGGAKPPSKSDLGIADPKAVSSAYMNRQPDKSQTNYEEIMTNKTAERNVNSEYIVPNTFTQETSDGVYSKIVDDDTYETIQVIQSSQM